jgi:hypothetical protein
MSTVHDFCLTQDPPIGIPFRLSPEKEIVVNPAPLSEAVPLRLGARQEGVCVVRITPRAYLKSILAIAWGAFRHPFSTTFVDLSTGESVHLPPRPRNR